MKCKAYNLSVKPSTIHYMIPCIDCKNFRICKLSKTIIWSKFFARPHNDAVGNVQKYTLFVSFTHRSMRIMPKLQQLHVGCTCYCSTFWTVLVLRDKSNLVNVYTQCLLFWFGASVSYKCCSEMAFRSSS